MFLLKFSDGWLSIGNGY